jgi:hypothetical protein
MADTVKQADAPADWLEVLAESEAELAAGRIVPAEVVHRMLEESLARLGAKRGPGRL